MFRHPKREVFHKQSHFVAKLFLLKALFIRRIRVSLELFFIDVTAFN